VTEVRTDVDQQEDVRTEEGTPAAAHIVKTERGENAAAKVLEARIYGYPVEALCGHRWIPSKNPANYPLCQACKEIYGAYQAFNDGLSDRPAEA
jgi:hypothetical protein